jgi:hypothetical protein
MVVFAGLKGGFAVLIRRDRLCMYLITESMLPLSAFLF